MRHFRAKVCAKVNEPGPGGFVEHTTHCGPSPYLDGDEAFFTPRLYVVWLMPGDNPYDERKGWALQGGYGNTGYMWLHDGTADEMCRGEVPLSASIFRSHGREWEWDTGQVLLEQQPGGGDPIPHYPEKATLGILAGGFKQNDRISVVVEGSRKELPFEVPEVICSTKPGSSTFPCLGTGVFERSCRYDCVYENGQFVGCDESRTRWFYERKYEDSVPGLGRRFFTCVQKRDVTGPTIHRFPWECRGCSNETHYTRDGTLEAVPGAGCDTLVSHPPDWPCR